VADATPDPVPELAARAAGHAALGEPIRLAIVERLVPSDRSPKELAESLGIASNLLAHHLGVLEHVGLIVRVASTADRRRRYVRLAHDALARLAVPATSEPSTTAAQRPEAMLFVCTGNSARSQLAAALWRHRTGGAASSAGTRPDRRIHRGAVAAAQRAGLTLGDAAPRPLGTVPAGMQVVTVCDRAHEELDPAADWWHWSVPDPVAVGTASAFDLVVTELDLRIRSVRPSSPARSADPGRPPRHRRIPR